MAAALTADDWAHGDLKPENIVADNRGRLHLIDFDAMFLPAFAGRHSPELGTAAYADAGLHTHTGRGAAYNAQMAGAIRAAGLPVRFITPSEYERA